jgi:hypothetical protein
VAAPIGRRALEAVGRHHTFDHVGDDLWGGAALHPHSDDHRAVGPPAQRAVGGAPRRRPEIRWAQPEATRSVGHRTHGGGEGSEPHGAERTTGVRQRSRPRTLPLVNLDELNPAQQRVVEGLMAAGMPRPSFAPDLSVRLRDRLEDALSSFGTRLGVGEMWISKARLQRVLSCEAHDQSEQSAAFEWSPSTARGTVVHRAIEVLVNLPPDSPPLDAVDGALRQLGREGRLSEWLSDLDAGDRAALRAKAGSVMSAFAECWPPLPNKWRPRAEQPMRIALCDERILLSGTVDLALGKALDHGTAGVLVVDFKTGNPHPRHFDDLRYYALLHTLRLGVPPFRVASYYLERADWHHEDVTEELLDIAVERVVDGTTRLCELHIGDRQPKLASGPQCRWCRLRDTCDEAAPPPDAANDVLDADFDG